MQKLLILLFIFLGFEGFAQKQTKNFVEKNLNIIRSIDPDSTDFTDVEVIGNAIGNSRIVMLGEQDHGDAPTFLAKTRLIKYLHEKKGFNVLAFESDFFALNEGWDHLDKQKTTINNFIQQNIFSIWTSCTQCENLFYNYVSESFGTNNPITISGFDSQFDGGYSNNLKKYIDDFFKVNDIPFIKSKSYIDNFLPFIDSIKISKDVAKQTLFIKQIDTIFKQISKKWEGSFELLVLHNLQESSKNGISFLTKAKDYKELRDKQMAENLKWLVNQKFPNQKIIVWAHSAHILKNREFIKSKSSNENWTNMGHFFTRDSLLNQQTYIVGFSSKYGTAGRITIPNTYKVVLPIKNSFEDWMNDNIKYAFVDFKRFRNLNPNSFEYFNMKGKYHIYNEAVWTQVFDGIFYIKDMYPCEKSVLKF
ncbi:erythromycin esterase family protein [Pedobacter boryungensis]|uniref:Erythromycin esterase family protein n=1 Tax=Pedobacter boryungensis TaxID=869962 RepID=A0ABX2DA01_9SPHI|nr:erythromycin esterase family protein [Pedobacter boryungensis]NQX30810.1 erythromycin esterase family protein [Pedobacter boryungensis]